MDCHNTKKNKKLELLILATLKDYELYKDAVIVNLPKKVLLDEEARERLQPEKLRKSERLKNRNEFWNTV
jgi:hypothetical protein